MVTWVRLGYFCLAIVLDLATLMWFQSVFVDAEPPKVRVTPSGPLSVRAGESVTLECSVTGKPRPSSAGPNREARRHLFPRQQTLQHHYRWFRIH